MTTTDESYLREQATLVRRDILESIHTAGSGHLAGSLGVVEILLYYYFVSLKLKPKQPLWSERDLFFLSAGHLCPALYAVLSRRGFFSTTLLKTLRAFGSPLQGHPHYQPEMGIECSSGSLGQGISQAVGAALALKRAGSKRRVVVLSSDGEQQEGQVWEAYLFAAHYQLNNFTLIIDCNRIQQSGNIDRVLSLGDLRTKFLSFNFACSKVDGHDFGALKKADEQLCSLSYPQVILAHTIPGKGISFLENDYRWHSRFPTTEQWRQIFAECALESQV